MATYNPATQVTLTGAGYATQATLKAGVAPNAGGLLLRPAVTAYWLANQPANQTTATGYAKGTPAYFAYLAWYMAACQGHVVSNQGNVYRNTHGLAGGPNGGKPNQPGRASAHALWVLQGQITALQGPKAAQVRASANAASALFVAPAAPAPAGLPNA